MRLWKTTTSVCPLKKTPFSALGRGLGADEENIWIHGRPLEEVLKTQVSCELPGKIIFIMMIHLDKQNQV